MGMSAGGMHALQTILPALPRSFPLPIAIVQHLSPHYDSYLAEYLDRISSISVKEAEDKEPLQRGTVYLAPPNYHLLVEPDQTFSLSVDARVNYCCPSIDVLFESASDVFEEALIGVVLTGANADGSCGLKIIKARGGLTIVQNPATAESPYMPRAALDAASADYVVDIGSIAPLFRRLSQPQSRREHGCSVNC